MTEILEMEFERMPNRIGTSQGIMFPFLVDVCVSALSGGALHLPGFVQENVFSCSATL